MPPELMLVAAVVLPFALLVGGLLLLGMAMPSARSTLERRDWAGRMTILLIVPASLVLLGFLVARDDADRSTWDAGGTELRVAAVAAFALAAVAVALQVWVMRRSGGVRAPRSRSLAAAAGGVAMLVMFPVIILAWLAGWR